VVRQGEIYDLTFGTSRFRALVVSADHHIATGHPPLCAPLLRRSVAGIGFYPYVVSLTDADSVGGVVQVGKVTALAIPQEAEPVGMISGASMQRVVDAVCDLLRD
jgi:mRNA-degrading endonuclease toxin of MazEF toxin-antitoxin module